MPDLDQLGPDDESKAARVRRRHALRWIGAGVFVILAGGLVAVLRYHWMADGAPPTLLRVGPLVILVGALLFIWGIVKWVRG
jgi:hypothetical protein